MICQACQMDESVHERYGVCPVVVIPQLIPSEDDERCDFCQHDHSDQSQEPDDLTSFRPGHSDICDCTRPDDGHQDYLTDRSEAIAIWNSR